MATPMMTLGFVKNGKLLSTGFAFAITFVAMILLLTGCQSAPEPAPSDPNAQKVVYSGMLPCADCSGIRTTLTLFRDQYDNPTRFVLREEYLNGSSLTLDAVERGDWQASTRTDAPSADPIFTLNPGDPSAQQHYIKDASNALERLDLHGNRIESDMNYRLLKH